MTRPVTLEYEKHAPPNRYEWEMETERARWLRRRFLWFTGTLVVVAFVMLIASVAELFVSSGSYASAMAVLIVAYGIQIGAAGSAWGDARQRARDERRLFAIAFWLVVGLGVLGICAKRASAELRHVADADRLEQRLTLLAPPPEPTKFTVTDGQDFEKLFNQEFPVSPR